MDRKLILVVDDEFTITKILRSSLSAHNYSVRVASDGSYAIDAFHDLQPDLVITDLSMPGKDGIEVCKEIRKTSTIPIIVLSVKGEEKSKIEALDSGADDYITKPFSMEELLARVRASLRRGPGKSEEPEFEIGECRVDKAKHKVYMSGNEVHLTPKEYDLLVYLIINHGKVLTHRTTLAAVWGGNYIEQSEYLRVFVANLRKKIEPEPAKPKYILTEHWVGYRFNPFK